MKLNNLYYHKTTTLLSFEDISQVWMNSFKDQLYKDGYDIDQNETAEILTHIHLKPHMWTKYLLN